MKKFMFTLLATTSLMFTVGCGGNTCDDLKDATNALNKKADTCSDEPTTTEPFDTAACENALDACTDSDKDKLSDLADCLQDLPNCKTGEELDWVNKLGACFDKIDSLSAACAGAAGG